MSVPVDAHAGAHGLFVSDMVARSHGAQLLQACAEAGWRAELVVLDTAQPLPSAYLARVTCALLSVDVLADSSKGQLAPSLVAFVAAMRAAPNLRWLQVCSAGMDSPLYAELQARNVRLTSAASSNAAAVAQSALAGILALARGVPMWVDNQRLRRWQPLRGNLAPEALEGQRAVVVGMGQIGLAIARILEAVDVRVTGVRRVAALQPHFEKVVTFAELDDVLPDADWLGLACPLTPQTRLMIDATRISLMRPKARLVNVSRGEVVDELALVDALANKRVAGAYLDVFAQEPLPPTSRLWNMEGVLLSAHSAGSSTAHQRNVVELFCRNIGLLAAGAKLVNERTPLS